MPGFHVKSVNNKISRHFSFSVNKSNSHLVLHIKIWCNCSHIYLYSNTALCSSPSNVHN